jgi:hypothetical protein
MLPPLSCTSNVFPILFDRKMREELDRLRSGMESYQVNITNLARDARQEWEAIGHTYQHMGVCAGLSVG